MKTITLKTEDPLKYLSILMLTDEWSVSLETGHTEIKNINTGQIYSFLDLKKEEVVVFENLQNVPEDWSCRYYYYLPDQSNWVKIITTEPDPIVIDEEQNDNTTT